MDTYPGNSSLADEVKRRIVGTYEQSLELAERGRSQEAILGCDFVLELDPQFAPARALRERLATGVPAGAPSDDLASVAAPSGAPEAPESDPFDLDDLGALEVPELEAAGAAPFAAVAGDGLAGELRERLAARDFRGVLAEVAERRDAVAADPDLARIAETAQARIEAQPYVEGFLREAGTAIRAGELERARGVLDKVRSLDPEHPLLADLEESLGRARGDGTQAAAPATPATAPPADEDEDFDLLDGFELPEAAAAASWEPETEQTGATGDPFSFDASELEDAGGLAAAPELASPTGAGGGAGQAEGDDRIAELLADGQRAADAGDHQGAIDAWSRIFLIDVDHHEAARRIENARRLKAERERKVEEVFHEGLAALEGGQSEAAKERFGRVLEMQPNHLAARDYLRQMESGEPVRLHRGPAPDETVAMGSLGTFDLSDLAGPGAAAETLREEILVPPPPGADTASEAAARVPALPGYGKGTAAQSGRRSFLLVGGLVLVLVLLAGWWLFDNKERFFPNSDAEETAGAPGAPADAGVAPGPIERANELRERGQVAMALGLLKRIRPDDPRYAEAQELIASWETPTAEQADEAAVPADALARRERLVAAAESAYRDGELLRAAELYEAAGQAAPLDGPAEENRQAVARQLEPLREEVELFELGEYDLLLPRLWRLYQDQPANRDVRRMLVDSYYNRGVRELQRGNAGTAMEEFSEALELAPDDERLQRHFLFAQTYERRNKDLLYRIYVKYLPVR